MITRPTVLVLGAGASNPYDYPTGKKLKQIIIDLLEQPSVDIYQLIVEQGFSAEEMTAFRKAFLLSGQSSIDAFLEHQPSFSSLGKIIITVILAKQENIERLHKQGDWYEHLFHALDNGVLEDFGNNKLAIITFNYDRSIETYLFNALKNSYNLEDSVAASILNKIPIIHLHGQIGYLPWQSISNSRDYAEMDSIAKLKKSSEGIKIIYEADVDKSDAFIKAKSHLVDAERIYFLGFGYHPENIRRLGITDINTEAKLVFGTCKGMTNLESDDIMGRCKGKINLRQQGARYFSILEFMRENISLT